MGSLVGGQKRLVTGYATGDPSTQATDMGQDDSEVDDRGAPMRPWDQASRSSSV
jgi:hypothetical protein